MKILSLNCRGLGSAAAVRALREIQERNNPQVMFLSETHLDKDGAEWLRVQTRMDSVLVAESDGRSGGLVLLWKMEISIDEMSIHPNYIDVLVDGGDAATRWRLTGLYGEPSWENKYKTWERLRDLHEQVDMRWMVIGDWNEILYSHEKEGGNPRPMQYMQAFRNALTDCGLEDLGYIGDTFTWRRKRSRRGAGMRERLDRACGNEAWSQLFPYACLSNNEGLRSDHRPILMDTEYYRNTAMSRSVRRRRFEGKWLKEEGVGEVVQAAWSQGLERYEGSVAKAVAAVQDALHAWDGTVLKKPRVRLRYLSRKLEEVLRGDMSEENIRRQEEITDEIEKILEQEEIYKMQRSRVNWLTHGDRNSAFFHNYAKARKKRNLIVKLKDNNGVWKEGNSMLKPLITDYFTNLFTSEVDGTDQALLDKVQPRVTTSMNERLVAPFTEEEVKKALFSIGDFKAPGTDGMHAIFFKKIWPLIGGAITKEVLESLQSGVIPTGWNETAIILIPKINNPELITQFRPISLCNVLYKIISKVLANRLKGILPEVISLSQSAFVPGRLITDNVLVAYECVHALKGKRQGKNGYCAVKLDMHKAYDRVEWSFLRDMMAKLGFADQWINLIMSCVSSVQYKIWFNSEETDSFVPTRGLRQGDPLSPYLFLLCAEGLSSLLTHEESSGGIQACR